VSAKQTFAYCLDCRELHYGIPDRNGVYSRDSGSSNHFNHNVHVFDAPETYQPPICHVLTKLHAGLPIGDNEIILFALAIDLGELDDSRRIGKKRSQEAEVLAPQLSFL
jgi:hypothetical protein